MNLSIILPTRNEEILIESTLKNIENFLDKRKITDYEILVVVNGTNDRTVAIVKKYASINKKVKTLWSKAGYGLALREGFGKAKGKYSVIFNVDFYDLNMIDLVGIDLYGKDFIIGSKMAHWSVDKRSFLRRMVSLLFNFFLKMAFGFKGSDTHGIKILRKTVVDTIVPKCKTDTGIFDTEFTIRAQYAGYKMADFPVAVKERRASRFSRRIWQTPTDIINLYRVLR